MLSSERENMFSFKKVDMLSSEERRDGKEERSCEGKKETGKKRGVRKERGRDV
jgi:hypothetical protein